jgi:hypothetical protein
LFSYTDLNNTGSQLVIDVLQNDNDADGDDLEIIAVSPPTVGALTISQNKKFILYTTDPNSTEDFEQTVTYTISDGNGGTATASLRIIFEVRCVFCNSIKLDN